MDTTPQSPETGTPPGSDAAALRRLEDTEEFRGLRRSFRGFAFPLTAAFITWYLLYVLLSNYAHGLMSTTVFGHINLALVLGLLQFASTFAIAWWYARHAARRLDPQAAAIRARLTTTTAPAPKEDAE